MTRALLLTVRMHDGRYHGRGDWPPSPARVFQALVAAGARGRSLDPEDCTALRWLERLEPPEIVAPPARCGQRFVTYVPNNDLDAVNGDLRRVDEIRSAKAHEPRLFDSAMPFVYAWRFDGEDPVALAHSARVCELAARLYQLGRGLDMAWASGEVVAAEQAASRLDALPGARYRPAGVARADGLDCPSDGSLASLERRFGAFCMRLAPGSRGNEWRFLQPPKPAFVRVAYESPPARQVFEIRSLLADTAFRPWAQRAAFALTIRLRDASAARLSQAWPDRKALIERVLVGRDAAEVDKVSRVRIVPLPSIGHEHADGAIRRVLVEVPTNSPLAADDVFWALSGSVIEEEVDPKTGEVLRDTRLMPASTLDMLAHYGIGDPDVASRRWRSVTPAALPEVAARRRIDPRRQRHEAKGGSERSTEERRASTAVLQALRHAGITSRVDAVRVQREPFARNGARAEAFAEGARFAKERLWHVEIAFVDPIRGPLVIGDGRFVGLGVMAPERPIVGVLGFRIVPAPDALPTIDLCRALRRAVMARIQVRLGLRHELPLFFTGHDAGGAPARSGRHSHLAFVADVPRARLLIVAPHVLEHRAPSGGERESLALLDAGMSEFRELRVRGDTCFEVNPLPVDWNDDVLFMAARCWESVTDYVPTRHAKGNVADGLATNVREEAQRRGLAVPDVEVLTVREGPRGGQSGWLRLHFARPVVGPILLGQTCHFGGGLFYARR